METRIVEYGTKHKVKVLSATKALIACKGDDGEGYLLMNHEIENLPKEGDEGVITFLKNDSRLKGYWHYEGK